MDTISAPYITACDNLPKAIFPSGMTTIAFNPALAAYAAADADVFPVDAQITTFYPALLLLVTAITMLYLLKRTCWIRTFIFYV